MTFLYGSYISIPIKQSLRLTDTDIEFVHNPTKRKKRNMDHHQPTREEVSKSAKDIDDWLPITKSRNAKWWYSAFHNVTAMVGAGVLGLPYAMSQLGWYATFVFWSK